MRPFSPSPPFRTCLICAGRTTNAYHGVDACRACAAFFKRAVLQKKQYICRTGKGQCTYRKRVGAKFSVRKTAVEIEDTELCYYSFKEDEMFPCPRCRLDACFAFGMQLADGSMPCTSSASRDPTNSCGTPDDIKPKRETLLERIGRLYESCIKRRSRNDSALHATARYRERFTISEATGEKLFISPVEFEHDATPIASTTFIVFLQKAFDEFNELSQAEQRAVYKNALSPVLILQSFQFSYTHFPKEPNRFFMNAMEGFMPDGMPCSQKKELARIMTYYFEKGGKIMDPAMRSANLSETEIVALVALLIWTFDSHIFSETIVDLRHRVKRAIFCDLSRYYREEGKEAECSTRIGKLMTIVHALQEGAGVMHEEMQMYALLELFDEKCYARRTFTTE